MENVSDIVDRLVEFAREQNLVARTLESCSLFLHNEAKENGLPRKLNPASVEMKFRSHSLTFRNNLLSHPYISTQLDLYVGDEEVGWYKLIVGLNGQAEDDYLMFHPEWRKE